MFISSSIFVTPTPNTNSQPTRTMRNKSHHSDKSYNHIPPLNPQTINHLSLALLNSVIKNTQQEIDANSSIIYQYQSQEYYAAYLFQIINLNLNLVDNAMNQILVSSAFSQLKVMARCYYYQKNFEIKESNKLCLVNAIIPTSLNITTISNYALHYKYLKLLKDIVFISYQDSIAIYPKIVQCIKFTLNQDNCIYILPVYLNILLGLFSDGREAHYKKYSQMVQTMHLLLLQFIRNGDQQIQELYSSFTQSTNQNKQFLKKYLDYKRKYEQILYQSIKLMYKAICPIYYKNIGHLLEWMTIALNRVQYIDEDFTLRVDQQRQGYTFNRNNIGHKGNNEFNYFHGKKWALKFVSMSLNKLFINRQNKKAPINSLALSFSQDNFCYMISIFKTIWAYRWPDRLQAQLLKCVEFFITSHSKKLAQHQNAILVEFQETILPPLMMLSKRQMEILSESAIQFLEQENNMGNRESIRMIAASIWVKIATIQYSYNPLTIKSQYLQNSLLIIKSWFQQNQEHSNQLTTDNGCFLLLRLKDRFLRQEEAARYLNPLVNQVIWYNLKDLNVNFNFMKLLRALELFTAYKSVLQCQISNYCKSIIIQCFTRCDSQTQQKGEEVILMLQCCKAFYVLIRGDEQAKREIGFENVKMVICKGLKLVEKTCYDEFIKEVDCILSECINDVSEFANEIALFLQNWFKIYCQKDIYSYANDRATQYKDNYIEIAKGTLSIFQTLIHFVRNGHQEVTKVIEKEIISIIFYLFSRQYKNESDDKMNEQAIWLLRSFLKSSSKGKKVSPQIMKIFKIIILKLAGLHQSIITQLKQRKQNENDKKKIEQYNIYINCHSMAQHGFEHCIGVMRNFIRYIELGQAVNLKELKILNCQTSYTQCLIYLPYRFFSSKQKDLTLTDQGRCFSLLMLIYYYQRHQQFQNNVRVHPSVNTFTLAIIKKTLSLYKQRPKFAKYNVQLFSLWMYEVNQELPVYFKDWNNGQIQLLFRDIFVYEHKNGRFGLDQIQTYQQQLRCIFGIGTYLRLMRNLKTLKQILPFDSLSSIVRYAIKFLAAKIKEEIILSQLEEENYQQFKFEEEGQKYSSTLSNWAKVGNSSQMDELEGDYEIQSQESDQGLNELDCIQFQQYEDQDQYTPLSSQNERLFFLKSLYELKQMNSACYWNIIQRQNCNEQMLTILLNCECFRQNSEYSHLRQLCDLNPQLN